MIDQTFPRLCKGTEIPCALGIGTPSRQPRESLARPAIGSAFKCRTAAPWKPSATAGARGVQRPDPGSLLRRTTSHAGERPVCDGPLVRRSMLPQIMEELSSDDPELRFEAARAAGELELRPALPRLVSNWPMRMTARIQEMAIWALGEIGGKVANKASHRVGSTGGFRRR